MDIIQIVALGIVSAILSITLRRESPGFSLMIGIITGVLIFMITLPKFEALIALLKDISQNIDVEFSYIGIALKVIGIAYIAEFGIQLCQDAGEGVIASKIEMAGKMLIMVASAPILITLMDLILSMV